MKGKPCSLLLGIEIGIIKGARFEGLEGHQKSRDDGAEGHPRRILPAVHRSVAEKDGKVHKMREDYFEGKAMYFVAWN